MRQKIQVAVDPDPDPETSGAFLEDVESENVLNDVDSVESMVVVMNSDLQTQETPSNTIDDETPASLRSPAIPASSGVSAVNLKTLTTNVEKPQEPEAPIQEPKAESLNETSTHEPSLQQLTVQEPVIENDPVQETLIEKPSVAVALTNNEPTTMEPRVIEDLSISDPLFEEPLNPLPLNETYSIPQALPEELLNQETLIEKISIPEDLVVGKLSSVPLIGTDQSQGPLTEDPTTSPGKKSVVSDVLQTSSSSYGEMLIPVVPQDENQNQKGMRENPRRLSSLAENSPPKTVSFNPNPIITYPIVVEPVSKTVIDGEKSKPTPTPIESSTVKTSVIPGPGLLPQATDSRIAKSSGTTLCPKCGIKIDAADTKLIPTSKIWGVFMVLFCCGFWWLSWIPFLCKCWHEPVEICPYCYRRLGRKPVSSNSVSP